MLQIKSNDLIMDFSGISDILCRSQSLQPNQWRRLGALAQESIEATIEGLGEIYADECLAVEAEKRDLTPRTMTNITFAPCGVLGFIQTLIYHPLPSIRSQQRWEATMIMDIRWLEVPKVRKTGAWQFAEIGNSYDEKLATAFHSESQTLAYSASIQYYDKSNRHKGALWYVTVLCIHQLSIQAISPRVEDPRGNYVKSSRFFLDGASVTSLQFSECGRYIFGVAMSWPGQIFQFDTWKGKTVRTIYDPFNSDGSFRAISLSLYEGNIFAIGVDNSAVMVARLPFRSNSRYEAAALTVAPSELALCKIFTLLWPSSTVGNITLVAHDTNFLRQNGNVSGTGQWPIVLSFKETDISEWYSLEERQPAAEDDSLEAGVSDVKASNRNWLYYRMTREEAIAAATLVVVGATLLAGIVIWERRWRRSN